MEKSPAPRKSVVVIAILSGIAICGIAILFTKGDTEKDRTLTAQAVRHGYEPAKFKAMQRMIFQVIEDKKPLSDADWETAKGFLRHPVNTFRQNALSIFSSQRRLGRHQEALLAVRPLLDDKDQWVTADAIKVLANLGDPQLKDRLRTLENDPREKVSLSAKNVLTGKYAFTP